MRGDKNLKHNVELLLKAQLEESDQPDIFWESIIAFIESGLKQYAVTLRSKGIDPSIFALLSKQNGEDSTKEKLNQIKALLVSLSRLEQAFLHMEEKSSPKLEREMNKLESELMLKNQQLKEKEKQFIKTQEEISYLKSEYVAFKQENEKKLTLQPKQIKTKLSQDLKLVRDRVNMIHEMVLQTNKDTFENLHGNVNDAIQTIVTQLAEKELWPEEEKKPETTTIKKEAKNPVKRSRRKKSEEKETVAAIDDSNLQVEFNLISGEEVETKEIETEEIDSEEVELKVNEEDSNGNVVNLEGSENQEQRDVRKEELQSIQSAQEE
jgi:hypothetical protein